MAKLGILVHVRHLETIGWEKLVWGVPEEDSLGSFPKLAELLLEEETTPIIVLGCGPSTKDGLSEGEYTKRYVIDRVGDLPQFERFASLTSNMLDDLREQFKRIIVTDPLMRSVDEIVHAAKIFSDHGVSRVYQITAASHAPRCAQIQSSARAQGIIPKSQQWFLVADDRCYEGTDPASTVVIEPYHRGDEPLLHFRPRLSDLLRSFHYDLEPEDKKTLLLQIDQFMREHSKE